MFMLSKNEKAWLLGTFQPSESYKRFLRYSIHRKLSNALSDLGVLTGSDHVREFSNELGSLASLLSPYLNTSYIAAYPQDLSLGRASNPRPLPNIDWAGFGAWCVRFRRIQERTAGYYVRYARNYLPILFESPELIASFNPKKRKWITTAMDALCDYLSEPDPGLAERIKTKLIYYQLARHSKPTAKLHIVEDGVLRRIMKEAGNIHGPAGSVVRLYLYSGLRQNEGIYLYENSNRLEKAEHGPVLFILLDYHRGSKHAYFTIVPKPVLEAFLSLQDITQAVNEAKVVFKAKFGQTLTYLRKVHFTVMSRVLKHQDADALQGRLRGVSPEHYMLYERDRLCEAYIRAWGLEVKV